MISWKSSALKHTFKTLEAKVCVILFYRTLKSLLYAFYDLKAAKMGAKNEKSNDLQTETQKKIFRGGIDSYKYFIFFPNTCLLPCSSRFVTHEYG